jgi:1-acyl-sn-glycerol-3-phosphate acyltransferase
MLNLFWKTIWKLSGWTIVLPASAPPKKMVLIAGPHTSWRDLLVALAARNEMRFSQIKFLGKKELFSPPFGSILRKIGGIPVDRECNNGIVQQAVDQFNNNDEFRLALSPEGTRKRVKRLRTGFYFIAKNANVPIVMVGLDFANKRVVISDPFFATDNQEKDFADILSFFAPIRGYHPELGLGHLRKQCMPVNWRVAAT